MDIDSIVGPPHAEWMRGAPPQVAIIRMFGVTAAGASCSTALFAAPAYAAVLWRAGNSVCCHIYGFRPYFYAAMPSNFAPDDVEAFRKVLNVRRSVRAFVRAVTESLFTSQGSHQRCHERAAEAACLRHAR